MTLLEWTITFHYYIAAKYFVASFLSRGSQPKWQSKLFMDDME